MSYTEQELNWLSAGLETPDAITAGSIDPIEDTGGILQKGKRILNLIPSSLNVAGRKLAEASQYFNPDLDLSKNIESAKSFVPTFDVEPNQDLADVLLTDVVPEIPSTVVEFLLPYGAVRKGAQAIRGAQAATRLSSALTEGTAQAVANVATLPRLGESLSSSVETTNDGGKTLADYISVPDPAAIDAISSGGLGFVSGVAQEALPRGLPRAGALAATSGLYYAKTGDVMGAIGNLLNIFPQGFKTTEIPVPSTNRFDELLPTPASFPSVESRLNPGEFNFVDQVPVSSSSPVSLGDDLFTRSPEFQLDRSPFQPELNLDPNLSPSGLNLNYFDDPLQPKGFIPNSPSKFFADEILNARMQGREGYAQTLEADARAIENAKEGALTLLENPSPAFPNYNNLQLEGATYSQQPLSPLLELQSQTVRNTPPPYQFLEETPIRRLDNTEDLFSPKTKIEISTPVSSPEFDFNRAESPSFSSVESEIHSQHFNAPGWTQPGEMLPTGFTRPAFEYGASFKTPEQVATAYRQADELATEGMRLLEGDNPSFDKAQELISKGQYLKEAAEYAEGLPSKVSIFRSKVDPNYQPSVPGKAYQEAFPVKVETIPKPEEIVPAIKIGDNIVKGELGDTHQDILNRWKQTATEDDQVLALMDFDTPENPNFFVDSTGKKISRAELKKMHGVEDSQGLRNLQSKPDLEEAKNLQARADEIRQDAKMALDEGKIETAASMNRMADVVEQKAKTAMLRASKQGGSISPEMAAVLAIGGVGAAIAFNESRGDIGDTLAATVLATGLGLAGVKSIKALSTRVGPKQKQVKANNPPIPNEKVKEKLKRFAKDTSRTPGGYAVMGRGGFWANAVRMAEGMTGLNVSEIFRDKKILAEGFISDQLEVLQKAIDNVKGLKPSDGFSDASSRYLRGQLASVEEVTQMIKAGGGKTGDEWLQMSAKDKKNFPEKWIVMDNPNNTNTQGPGVTVYHVTSDTKNRLNELQRTQLKALATNPADKEFLELALKARSSIDNLMQVIHAAVPPGERLNRILGTMGQYASRTHELLTNPKYYPSDVEIGNAMDRIGKLMEERFIESLPVSAGTGGVIRHGGKTYTVSPSIQEAFDNLYTPESLRSQVTQYIKEIKQIAAGNKLGILSKDTEQLGSSIFTGRKELDEVTQALLATHKSPVELIQQTINRLIPSARSAHFMKDLIGMTDEATGLRMSYQSNLEYNKAINSIKDAISQTTDPKSLDDLNRRLQELSAYIPISGQQPKMGLFQGAYVSRAAYDQLAGFDNPFGFLDNSIGRSLAKFNQIIKEAKLVANPIVHVRNLLQIPFFLAIGNAAASPAAWKTAYDAMKDPLSSVGRRLAQNGVFIGNVVEGEFRHSLQELLDGSADNSIYNLLKKGREKAHQLYAMPDNFVRAATYLAEEARAAKKFGVSVDVADPRVTAQARQFMSRRTMDYANVPQWVKTGRQIPMVSMFLSYTHEIMRLSKNLAVDAMKGDLAAGSTLAGLSTLPFMLQQMAENQLNEKDLKDWNKIKNVAQDYSRPRFKLPTSRKEDGTFNYVDISPLFPLNDFQLMIRSLNKGDMESVAAVNPFVGLEKTPLLSIISEQITGKERHTAKEYRDSWDRSMSIARQLLPPHTPGIGTEYVKDVPEELGGNLGQTNLKTGRTNTIKGALLRHLTGIDYTQVSPSIATKNAIRAAQHEIANERQYLRDVLLTSGLSQEAKNRAKQRYLEAVHLISTQLENKL